MMTTTTTAPRCMNSGQIAGSREAERIGHCSRCGFRFPATPRHNRRVAGEIVEGWTIRIPAHREGAR